VLLLPLLPGAIMCAAFNDGSCSVFCHCYRELLYLMPLQPGAVVSLAIATES
jgi:hypothetical protein